MGQHSGTLELTLGLLVGALGGFVAGLLVAPQSGTKTRESLYDGLAELKVRTNEVLESVRGNTESLLNSTRSTIEQKLSLLNEALEAGKKAAAYKREELIEGEGPVS
ncbi:MAG: YtxH domain-containing protein [Cyanobacteria bacterium NC_groundwater_1444_Ag_S-0.65um_54_12]|nr:YtxH domain-containing protein [Cyanobacteria bacterium NC_groundwater_1444_Ag_S-0.65um_54_12]